MKSAKRHELQKNELADWLGEHIEAAKPHATAILIGVLTIVAVIAFGIYYSTGTTTAGAPVWNKYFTALSEREPVAALEELAKADPHSAAGLWAKQSLGDINAARGAMQLFSDREAAQKSLTTAEMAYKEVDAAASDPMLKSRCRLGLAKVYESLDKPEEAKKFYQLVAAMEQDSAIGKLAQEGVARMSDPREIATLAWFAKQKPSRPSAFPGMGPGTGRLPDDLPERPNLSLPGFGTETDSSPLNLEGLGTGKTPTTPGLEFPKPGEGTPGEGTPSEPAPAEPPAEPSAAKPE